MSSNNPYKKYFNELESLVDKILTDRPVDSDFTRLEHLLSLGGLSNSTINSLYHNCGFNSWAEFYDTKRGICSSDKLLMIDCVEDKLRGALSSLKFVFRDKIAAVA